MLLSDSESKTVWQRVYDTLHFKPSINSDVIPFKLDVPYVIFDISSINHEVIDSKISEILVECTLENEYLYALDWQHSNFKFNPRNKDEQQDTYVTDDRYFGGGYNAYFPSFYPDGDYYFFLASDFRFGYLGHPWQNKIWIFGEKLIEAIKKNAQLLGFNILEEVN